MLRGCVHPLGSRQLHCTKKASQGAHTPRFNNPIEMPARKTSGAERLYSITVYRCGCVVLSHLDKPNTALLAQGTASGNKARKRLSYTRRAENKCLALAPSVAPETEDTYYHVRYRYRKNKSRQHSLNGWNIYRVLLNQRGGVTFNVNNTVGA